MDEPSYDVIANPISAFTTFGEAAPNPEATVAGMEAAEPPRFDNILAQLTNLSGTLTDLYYDQQRKEGEVAGVRGGARIEESEAELFEMRKDNALSIAGLIDRGVLTADENPWFYVGAKRALAKLNAQAIEDALDANLDSDFANNEAFLNSDPEPAVAIARYLGGRTNPLNLSADITDDYYYSSNFESVFSKIRRRGSKRLIELRNAKALSDQVSAVQGDVADALRRPSPSVDLPEGALDIDGNPFPTEELTPSQAVAAVISDYQNRAVFGNNKLTELVGSYLIELAKEGDVVALEALQNARLSGGQTLLDNDAVKAEYTLEEASIARGVKRYQEQTRVSDNRRAVELGENAVAVALRADPDLSIRDLGRIEGVEYDPRDGNLIIPQKGARDYTIPYASVKQAALDDRFEYFRAQAQGTPVQQLAAAMDLSMRDGYVHPRTKSNLDRAAKLMSGGRTIREEDLPPIQSALAVYRAIDSSGDRAVMNAYFTGETRAMMYLIDLLEKGDEGPLSPLVEGVGSGNLLGALATVQQIDFADQAFDTQIKQFRKDFYESAENQGINPELLETIRMTAETAVRLGYPQDASTVINTFTTRGKHYAFSSMYNTTLDGDSAETLFDGLVEYVQESRKELRQGTISRTVQEAAVEYGGEIGTDAYREWLSGVKFVHTPDANGDFQIQVGQLSLGADRFALEMFRDDLNYRLANPEVNNVKLSETLTDSEQIPIMGGG